MPEYIERKPLNHSCYEIFEETVRAGKDMTASEVRQLLLRFEKAIQAAPTIDAVLVVRCKDCLYWESGENECEKWEYCKFHEIGIGPYSFCSCGERKGGSE